jgi:hypothetical protein
LSPWRSATVGIDQFDMTADRIRLISEKAPGDADVMIELFPLPHDTDHPAPSSYSAHRHFEATAACVSEFLPPLAVGTYEAWVHVGESSAYVDFPVVEAIRGARP